jgi:hypothetical protein
LQRVCGERGGKRHTDRERDDDVGVREAIGAAGVAQPEDDRRDAGGEQGEARRVQARPWRSLAGLVCWHEPRGEDEACRAERHVDPEHEPPAEVGENRAADERAEDRRSRAGRATSCSPLLGSVNDQRSSFTAAVTAAFAGLLASTGLSPADVRTRLLGDRPMWSDDIYRRAHERGELDLDKVPPPSCRCRST